MSTSGWIGFDLDGTLALYEGFKGHDVIGEPIAPMVERVRALLAKGIECRIFTARVSDGSPETLALIQNWSEKHIGVRLKVTNVKDYAMWLLYDDRAVAVETNTGRTFGWREPREDGGTTKTGGSEK